MNLEMQLLKSTKNTHVYSAGPDANAPAIPTLYIKKEALPDPAPAVIRVTVEHDD